MAHFITFIVFASTSVLSTASALLNNNQVPTRTTESTTSNEIWHKLFNLQEQLITIQKENSITKKDNGDLKIDIAAMKVRLDQIEKENEDLKKNQSAFSLEVEHLQSTCKCGNVSSITTGDATTLSSLKTRLDEWEGNQTKILNIPSSLNASIESVKLLQKASAAVVSSLQGEQIRSNLLISVLQQNLSNAEINLESRLTSLNNSLLASRRASSVVVSSLQGEQLANKVLMFSLQQNLTNTDKRIELGLKTLNTSFHSSLQSMYLIYYIICSHSLLNLFSSTQVYISHTATSTVRSMAPQFLT